MIIEINKDLIPYTFSIDLGDIYEFTIRYNKEYDFFTIDLTLDEEIIVLGEKIVYGRPLFAHLQHLPVPPIPILPVEIADTVKQVNWETLEEEVFLYLGDTNG